MHFAGPLVVAILVVFLSRTGRRDRFAAVGYGVLAAIPATAAAWIAAAGRPRLFEAIAALAAVVGIAVLLLWLRRTVRILRGELTGRLEDALGVHGWAVAAIAFLAALSTGASVNSLLGAAAAAGLGWAASTATAGTDPRHLLTWAGALLIPVAAGLLARGVHGLQRVGILPGADRIASGLGGATVLEAVTGLAFIMVMTAVYFRPVHPASPPHGHAVVILAAVAVVASSCGGSAPKADAGAIAVTATATECRLSADHTVAGPRVFDVRNQGAEVTEFYVYAGGDRVIGEVENIAPGVSRTLHVDLPAGTYTTSCRPGMTGTGIRAAFTVSESGGGTAGAPSADPALTAAAATYQDYVRQQAAAFVDRTGAFVAAVKAGDRAKAQVLYAPARAPYERIETVAETFGDLDPKIDARDGDLDPGTSWTGYHRIEQQLWTGADLAAVAVAADQLLADVNELRTRLDGATLTALEIANGAKSLLDEVATKKVTGEEDRYSHTDLWDFAANLEGCRAVIAALKPAYDARLDDQFAAVDTELAQYKEGEGFVPYDTLRPNQVQRLAAVVNALAERVSAVPAAVAHR
ncbi:iron uptake system protein EfeO [Dactylosporangium sp. NPDC051541]|uniref:iron uptake system protein EfeO n=1 Tax=Dactylosporangium sp. NPDC051541 TaxID=3363977 RepID=UPI0037B24167